MSKYDMLNDCNVDVDHIQEVPLSIEQKNAMFLRVKNRIDLEQQQRIKESNQNNKSNKINNNNNKKHKKVWFSVAALAVVACICFVLLWQYKRVEDNPEPFVSAFEYTAITVIPTKQMAKGVAIDTQFKIRSEQDVSIKDIKNTIKLTPALEYEVEEVKKNEFILTTKSNLKENEVVNIIIQDEQGRVCKSWAFQTEGSFRILDSYPKDKADYVSYNTGIELIFSDPDVSEEEIRKNVTIEPSIDYTVKKYNATYVLLVNQLERGEQYRVAVDGALKNSAGEALGEDFSFEFKTQIMSSDTYFHFLVDGTHTYTPEEIPAITVLSSNDAKDVLEGSVYRINSLDTYLELITTNQESSWKKEVDLSNTTLVQSFDINTKVEDVEYYFFGREMILPNQLDKGYYVLAITPKDSEKVMDYKIIQISELGVYATSDDNSILVWVNDSTTGQSVEGANVKVVVDQKTLELRTDANGLAIFKDIQLEAKDSASLFVTTEDNKIFCNAIINNAGISSTGTQFYDYMPYDDALLKNYFFYLYTDKSIYMPTDTVQVWGVLRPRNKEVAMPKELKLSLQEHFVDKVSSLYQAKITLSKDGTFTAQIPYEYLASSVYGIILNTELGDLFGRNIYIEEYTKPNYILEASTDKELYDNYQGEDITVSAQVRFYDGTPVTDVPIDVRYYYSPNIEGAVYDYREMTTTDSNGNASIQIGLDYDGYVPWFPTSVNYSIFTNDIGLEQSTSYYGSFYLALRDTMIRTTVIEKGNQPIFKISTNRIDYSKLKSVDELYDSMDELQGPAIDTTVHATVTLSRNEKISLGYEYDPIYNENVERFEYNYMEEIIGNYELNTVEGKAVLDQLPTFKERDISYRIDYFYKDSKGRLTKDSFSYHNNRNADRFDNDVTQYTFKVEDNQYEFDSTKSVKMALRNNYSQEVTTDGVFLYYTLSDQIRNINVTKSKEFEIGFSENLVPNYVVNGAYFDGKHVYSVANQGMYYDSTEKEVEVQIDLDKKQYMPAEKASIVVKVLDQSQKPVSNARALIAVVDEAIYSLMPNSDKILEELYRTAYRDKMFKYVSYVPRNSFLIGGAEGGGDMAGGGIRKNFMDTCLFKEITIGKDGTGTIEVELPDNITSWRVVALVITDDMRAGSNKENLIVAKDLYLNTIVNTRYIAGDDIAVTVRGDGAKAMKGKTIQYEATLIDPTKKNNKTITLDSKIGEIGILNFGKLPIGDYSVKIVGKSDKLQDGIQLDFQVVESGINIQHSKKFNIKDKIEIQAKLYPISLTFYNSEYELYQQIWNNLSSSRTIRNDEKLALQFANDLSAKNNEIPWNQEEYTISDFIGYDGGIGDLPAANSNPEFTARLVAADPDFLNNYKTINYFASVLKNKDATMEQVAAAYMGLAALKQPVLFDIQYLLEEEELNPLSRMYLIAGLALIGDSDGANQYYQAEIKPKLVIDEKNNKVLYQIEGGLDTQIYHTAIASITTSTLNVEESDMVINALLNSGTTQYLFLAEKMVYLRTFRPLTEEPAAFEYTLDGKKVKETLDKVGYKTITLSKEQLEQLNLKHISGNVDMVARYIGPAADLEDQQKDIVVEKKVEQTAPREYRVTITYTMKDPVDHPSFVVDDYVPSGARYIESSEHNRSSYWIQEEAQRIRIYYNPSMDKSTTFTVSYRIRTAVPGEYVMDSAIVTLNNNGNWGTSSKTTVMIEK